MVTFVANNFRFMSTFYPLTIKEIRRETQNAVSIVFEIPENLKSTFQYIAGQYITIKKELNGSDVRRSYSICSAPNSEEFRIAVKAVPNGTFSLFATSKLMEGDVLDVAPPEGRFILESDKNNENNYLAIAAGSGITPIMGMIKEVLINEPSSTFNLIYSNKSEEETIFKSEIDQFLNQYPNQFAVFYIYSRVAVDNALFGRVDEGNIRFILNKNYSNTTFDTSFLCGPEPMIDVAKTVLINYGIKSSAILTELFSSTPVEPQEIHQGTSLITVLVDDEETTFEMETSNTILTAALNEGIDAPYSCQGGICSSCLAKITSGSAVMDKNTILSDEEVEEGFILTCQAHPISQKIAIDYDDV